MGLDYAAVVLKGVVEHQSAGAYFGSFGALSYYIEQAVERGWLDKHQQVTPAGREAYQNRKLNLLPRAGRAYMWSDQSGLRE